MRARYIMRVAALLVLGAALEAGGPAADPAGEQGAASENELRAVFLLNFARFITWPAERPDDPGPLVFGVAGDTGFAETLSRVVRGQTVRGKPLEVVALKGAPPPPGVHILYIASAQDRQIGGWLEASAKSAILTVSAARDFCQQGGMIRMYSEDRRIRFEINLPSLQRSRLRASSRLLALSKPAEGAK
jgi:hypothetical protein